MSSTNFHTALAVIAALDEPARADAERAFRDAYQNALSTSGQAYAEAIAAAEAKYWLVLIDISADGYGYLAPYAA